jgi:hypothetical protein
LKFDKVTASRHNAHVTSPSSQDEDLRPMHACFDLKKIFSSERPRQGVQNSAGNSQKIPPFPQLF